MWDEKKDEFNKHDKSIRIKVMIVLREKVISKSVALEQSIMIDLFASKNIY